jgi:hypothetical protein
LSGDLVIVPLSLGEVLVSSVVAFHSQMGGYNDEFGTSFQAILP